MAFCSGDLVNSFEKRELLSLKNHYFVEEILGCGSYGAVFRAKDLREEREMALKIVPKRHLRGLQDWDDLKREVSVLSRVRHENIVTIYNAFEYEDNYCIAMELGDGGALSDEVLKTPGLRLSERRALGIIAAIFDGLEYLHTRGIAHRDMKPDNVVFSNGVPKIIDFGACHAKAASGPVESTRFVGTQIFMPPEMLALGPYVPEAADLWACGVMLASMLAGTLRYAPDGSARLCLLDLEHVSKPTNNLLESLMNTDAGCRPPASQAAQIARESIAALESTENK